MRILGIDYGDARIGLALSDPTATIAGRLGVQKSLSMRKDIDAIADIVASRLVEKIVLGLPLNMDGTEGDRACKTRAFGRNLQKVSNVDVVYVDERLSTIEAQEALIASGVPKKKHKGYIDETAAQIILQSYLDNPKCILN